MNRQIRAWRKILAPYTQRKPYAHLCHLAGYLKNCEAIGDLLPDPYIPTWRDTLRRLIPRAAEADQIALVTLYEYLGEVKQ
jgi:hypothetical protein